MLKMELAHMIVALVESMLKQGDTEHALFVPLRMIGYRPDGSIIRQYSYLFFARQSTYTLVGAESSTKALQRTSDELAHYVPLAYHDSGWRRDGIEIFLHGIDMSLSKEVAPNRSPKLTEIKTVFWHAPELGIIDSLTFARDDLMVPIDVTWKS